MKSLFWVALNLIGFAVLVLVYADKNKNRSKKTEKTAVQKYFDYFLLSIMLFLVFDTGMFLLDGMTFRGAIILNYASSMLFYITSPLPGLFYLLYCDSRIFQGGGNFKKRTALYAIPAILNTIILLSTPFTHLIFYINEYNLYIRGNYFWISVLLSFNYVFAVMPLLIVYAKKKKVPVFRNEHYFLYLFPIPPFILTVIQTLNYGVLLIGFGFVISAFLIYVNRIQSSEEKRSLSSRFRSMHIIEFAIVSSLMMAGVFLVLENKVDEISEYSAANNSVGNVRILETYLNKETGVLGTIAHSKTTVDWFTDENDSDKKQTAYYELRKSLDTLYNDNIYIVIFDTGHEYWIDSESTYDDLTVRGTISEGNPKDAWVFDLMDIPHEYNLNVDYAKGTEITDVWLNFKVTSDTDEPIGIICTRMEFSEMVEQAFLLEISNTQSRTLIIDEGGIIKMDSALIGNAHEGIAHEGGEDVLLYSGISIDEEITDPDLLSAIKIHLDSIDGYFSEMHESSVIHLSTGVYSYATITPIGLTNWTLVTLYHSSSLFGIMDLLSLFVIIAILLILSAYSLNRITARLIFSPINQLVESLNRMRKNNEESLYGTQRSDEIGVLSNAIQDYFTKGYYDELTGIHNRRYLDTTMSQMISSLSRTEYKLSVMLIDIDFFKKYNDTYGHGEGDNCLKQVAGALSSVIMRKGDFVARYGGEEFAVVLPHANEDGARALAENMLTAVRDLKIPHEQNTSGIVTISIGVTTGDNTSTLNHEDYLKKADVALYLSKENGRDRYTFVAFT